MCFAKKSAGTGREGICSTLIAVAFRPMLRHKCAHKPRNALQEARVGAGLTAHVVNFHRGIYNALCERNGERAARLMADHVADIQKRLQPHLIRGRGPAAPRQWISAPLRVDERTWDK